MRLRIWSFFRPHSFDELKIERRDLLKNVVKQFAVAGAGKLAEGAFTAAALAELAAQSGPRMLVAGE